jgi:hypothetical protein
MNKTLYAILILVFGSGIFAAEDEKKALPEEPVRTAAIDDGFFIDGTEGWLRKEATSGVWSFAADKAIKAGNNKTLAAGQPIQMLPCAVLEQMTTLAGQQNQLYVRLWALFTNYNHTNYLYSVYFLPIRQDAGQPQGVSPDTEPNQPPVPKPAKPETPLEDSIIPSEILTQIKSSRTPDLKKFQQIAAVTGDINLIGRTGYLTEQNGDWIFHLDGFGMKIDNRSFLLLANDARQTAEKQMSQIPGRQRYNVSGLLTTCNGRTYLLLRRATRTYTHGNFTP